MTTETKTKIDEDTLEVRTSQQDHIRTYKKADLEAKRDKINEFIAELEKK